MRISWAGLRRSTPGGGFSNSHYRNSLQMAIETQAVLASSVLHGPGLGPRAGPARSPWAGPGHVSIIVCGPGRVRA